MKLRFIKKWTKNFLGIGICTVSGMLLFTVCCGDNNNETAENRYATQTEMRDDIAGTVTNTGEFDRTSNKNIKEGATSISA